jgi:hypothetical protein
MSGEYPVLGREAAPPYEGKGPPAPFDVLFRANSAANNTPNEEGLPAAVKCRIFRRAFRGQPGIPGAGIPGAAPYCRAA